MEKTEATKEKYKEPYQKGEGCFKSVEPVAAKRGFTKSSKTLEEGPGVTAVAFVPHVWAK